MDDFVTGTYIVCAIFFILSLGGLSNQLTAKRGNYLGIIAMTLAIIATFFADEFDYQFAIFFFMLVLGGLIGCAMALRVEMINMPQMVAALHSFVGLAATLVSFGHYLLHTDQDNLARIETNIGVFIGAVTFTGSVVAWGKLQGVIRSQPLIILGWGRHVINCLCIIACIAIAIVFGLTDNDETLTKFFLLLAISFIAGFLGWHLVMAIGGADMPVVVSMLNSYSGWATSASGFLLENELLIITGALVGSSGAILSYIMCKAMNRSFISVISGGFGQGTGSPSSAAKAQKGEQKPIDAKGMLNLLRDAKRIIIVPGYGMAVARCQHDVGTFADFLIKRGRRVEFCIHPVAGRLPGHMNVLLAEAEVDYGIVREMDEINKEFPETDIVMVIGANDIVNPDAQDDPNSPIAGMPVCEVWKAKNVIVFKRGGGTGYAGVENPLFLKPNTKMYFGNADKSMKEILNIMTMNETMFGEAKNSTSSDTGPESSDSEEEVEKFPEPKMTIGVPKEITPLEQRVAITPGTVKKFRKLGFRVVVEKGAGEGAKFSDEEYTEEGAEVASTEQVWACDIVLKVKKPDHHPVLNKHEDTLLQNTKLLVSYVYPANNKEWLENLASRYPNLTYLAMECVPRITKAQKLDSLSSMANIGGYRAVVEAFQYFRRCPKPMITAAGKLPPAEVLVIGAGVAGLSAIGYCKNLGCNVYAMDTRSAAKVDAESMGAKFLSVPIQEEGQVAGGYAKVMSEEYQKAQYQLTKRTVRKCDIVITTALIPGRPAPKLVDDECIKGMRPGSVVVDMAAEMGGNCAYTKANEVIVTENGVTIVGFTDLTSRMAPQSSELYANNLYNLLDEMGGAEKFNINMKDEIIAPMSVVHEGKMVWSPPKPLPPPKAPEAPKEISKEPEKPTKKPTKETPWWYMYVEFAFLAAICAGGFIGLAYSTYGDFMSLFMTFVLAVVIGYMVIWNVTPALHTPLMSVTNAISGIIVIGAMMLLDSNDGWIDEGSAVGAIAIFFASINIFGGFIVTDRMLSMFKTNAMPEPGLHHHNTLHHPHHHHHHTHQNEKP
ncbi:unnamed protein product [Blepharisma stoltei]|uniref:proton-translocating NAD(P)(+) transhydrogenase n=1 Tax=Blepharisma stoltei TaxID=1481888 RepID=A0AAU9JY02_9CILI|nr:unnamed protein product [Blepharisma stoltei]